MAGRRARTSPVVRQPSPEPVGSSRLTFAVSPLSSRRPFVASRRPRRTRRSCAARPAIHRYPTLRSPTSPIATRLDVALLAGCSAGRPALLGPHRHHVVHLTAPSSGFGRRDLLTTTTHPAACGRLDPGAARVRGALRERLLGSACDIAAPDRVPARTPVASRFGAPAPRVRGSGEGDRGVGPGTAALSRRPAAQRAGCRGGRDHGGAVRPVVLVAAMAGRHVPVPRRHRARRGARAAVRGVHAHVGAPHRRRHRAADDRGRDDRARATGACSRKDPDRRSRGGVHAGPAWPRRRPLCSIGSTHPPTRAPGCTRGPRPAHGPADNGTHGRPPGDRQHPRRSRLLPVPRRRGPGHLRREGQEPAQPPLELLRAARDVAGAHLPDGADGRSRRVDRRQERGRGVLPRVQPDQAAQAALQHPAEGRQVVPVPRGHARRGVAAGDGDARPAPQGRPLLRAVRARVRDPRDARPPAAHVPDPHVHQLEVRPAPPPRPAVPLRAHREVRGAVRRRHRPRRVHEARAGAARLPRRRARRGHPPPRGADERTRRTSSSSSSRRGSATSSRACARRSNASRWSARREEDYDLIGLAEDPLEASVQLFFVRKGRVVGPQGSDRRQGRRRRDAGARRAGRRAALRRRAAGRRARRRSSCRSSPRTSTSTRSSSR